MNKKLASISTYVIVGCIVLNGNMNYVYADSQNKYNLASQVIQEKEIDQTESNNFFLLKGILDFKKETAKAKEWADKEFK
ncbi:hypothetical protein COK29_29735, partial [Bacillus cereus]|uniref:hypothetical protein n=1 Tax=Bacillus cereus TaxID=1396 RepID=UPI000C01BA00